ncbi:MAG: hypothetical protein QGH93_01215 [Gammaproteobacteria bacterium]|nr:hypothetical protein [Gammaproteobacteria bacterium]
MNTITVFLWRYALLISLLVISTVAQADGQRISDAGRRAISPEIAVGGDGAITADQLPAGTRWLGCRTHTGHSLGTGIY